MLGNGEMVARLVLAGAMGSVVGFERERLLWAAGLRTHMLVCVGACLFMIVSAFGFSDVLGQKDVVLDPSRVAAQVVSGIGFLGAGVIMKEGMNVRGLNTAATLWCSAAVGAFSGADLPLEACFVTIAVLAGNTLLRPLVNLIDRIPIDESATEATYAVQVTVPAEKAGLARDLLVERLEAADYPVGATEVEERGETSVDVIATLTATTVHSKDLDAVVADLEKRPEVRHATWSVQTGD